MSRHPAPSGRLPMYPEPVVHGVVAGLIIAEETGYVLVGVRDRKHNLRHPGVVSIPTLRVPLGVAEELCRDRVPDKSHRLMNLAGQRHPLGTHGATVSLEGLVVEALLAKKLLLADALVSGALRGHCSVQLAMFDEVEDANGGDGGSELTLMVTLLVDLTRPRTYVPTHTASYSMLAWVPGDELMQAWQERSAQRLFPYANPFEICIKGLCIRSAVHIIQRMQLGTAGSANHELALLGEVTVD